MSTSPLTLLEEARAWIEADPDAVGLVDRCSLTTVDMVTLASDIPCLREPAGRGDQIVVDGEAFMATDRIFLIKQSATEAITPRNRLTVYPEDGTDPLIYEKPQIIKETLNPLITVKAIRMMLLDICRLIVNGVEHEDVPCGFSGGSGDVDGAAYRIRLPWGSPAVVGAAAIVDAISGRPQITLQLVEPVEASTDAWQEWRATSGPAYGRVDVGL